MGEKKNNINKNRSFTYERHARNTMILNLFEKRYQRAMGQKEKKIQILGARTCQKCKSNEINRERTRIALT